MFSSNASFIETVLSEFDISVKLALSEQVRHLVNDTREVKSGDIFCAVNGTQQKGRDFRGSRRHGRHMGFIPLSRHSLRL